MAVKLYDLTFWRGARGGDTPSTSSTYEQFLPLITSYFKMFLERYLNQPHFKSFLLSPLLPPNILIIHKSRGSKGYPILEKEEIEDSRLGPVLNFWSLKFDPYIYGNSTFGLGEILDRFMEIE